MGILGWGHFGAVNTSFFILNLDGEIFAAINVGKTLTLMRYFR
jgi:hypothetical protein